MIMKILKSLRKILEKTEDDENIQFILEHAESIQEAVQKLKRPLSKQELLAWKTNRRKQSLGSSPAATSLRDE